MQTIKKNWEWYLLVLGVVILIACFTLYGSPAGKVLVKTTPVATTVATTVNQTPTANKTPGAKLSWTTPPEMSIETSKTYYATLMTNDGPIKLELFANKAPKTVNSFVFLIKQGFYDGLTFHRIIKNFMIQGGDPTGTGSGGPGYKFEDEINDEKIVPGTLAMANAGPNTNGSQFFIVTEKEQPQLDGSYTVFGKVVDGMANVTKIAAVKTLTGDKPEKPITIERAFIEEK